MSETKTPIKRMSVREFRELGLLQEVNRRFLHPMGLALEVFQNEGDGTMRFGEVWDYREDPEGIAFRDDDISDDKSREARDYVDALIEDHRAARVSLFGGIIQTIPSGIPPKPEGPPNTEVRVGGGER